MQWWYYVLIGLGSFLIFLLFFSLGYAKKTSVRLNKDEFKQKMRKGQLIDVRSQKEYAEGHINGARNITLALLIRTYSRLRHDQPIYLYCNTGKRSQRAAAYLQTKGFKEVYQLENGLKSWTDPLKK